MLTQTQERELMEGSMYMWVAIALLVNHIWKEKVEATRQNYAMYVWTKGFDHSIPGCGVNQFLDWNTHGQCFSHVWDTPEKRKWLWNTCNLTGREVTDIFLSDVHKNLQYAKNHGDCNTSDVVRVRNTLEEGHKQVQGLKIYGLYAVSDLNVSEKDLVQYIVYYNDHCAVTDLERFDGVAINNEAYAKIKCASIGQRLTYLKNLKKITTAAKLQRTGTLLTHYSMSWHWGLCDNKRSLLTWNNKTSDVLHHMIDIFDSIDVQVGYIIFPAIRDRMIRAGYDYAKQLGKPLFTTLYTDKTSPCQITFFPDNTCRIHGHSEKVMFNIFDEFENNGIDYARACIHYFRGVYSSGAHPDWPEHGNEPAIVVG